MNDAYTQQALAADANFRVRARAALSTVAWEVESEDPATANHVDRLGYARQVIRSLDGELSVILPTFVTRPNVFAFDTTYVFDFVTQSGHVQSASGDPDLQSQLHTDWDAMASAAGFNA